MNDKYCENCKHYKHEPNILGGVTECELDVKSLNTFWRNNACDKYTEVSTDAIPETMLPGRLSELMNIIKQQP